MSNSYVSPRVAVKMNAGRETALADYRAKKIRMPHEQDCEPWATGYRLAVEELAASLGRANINALIV